MSPPAASSAQINGFSPGVIGSKIKRGILLLTIAYALAGPGRDVAIVLDDSV